ncbi:MAG: glutaminase [Cyanobacteria bacterium]|nr:glutaminase [Cyanobacteria bacterium bin.51]
MDTVSSWISTGQLPDTEVVQALVREAHRRFGPINEGLVADYIPAGAGGDVIEVGDSGQTFSIQSLSKPFMFALVCQAIGEEEAREKLGVNSTGLPFNSVLAAERSAEGLSNPMVNAGAIAAIHCQHVLAVMVTAGLYETSGAWLYDTGLPGKSGVAGGMITVAPGKGGLATYSPPLDRSGNSVRGQLTARFLSDELGLNLFASRPGCSG